MECGRSPSGFSVCSFYTFDRVRLPQSAASASVRGDQVPISEIKKANGLTGDTIYAGKKLIMP